MSSSFSKLIESCWSSNPANRPSLTDIICNFRSTISSKIASGKKISVTFGRTIAARARPSRSRAHEDGWEFRNVVAVRTFLDVLKIVETKADDLARVGDRQRVFQTLERLARRRRRALGDIRERLEVAVVLRQHSARSVGTLGSAACRSTTWSPSTTPSRWPASDSNATIFMSGLTPLLNT